MKTLNVMAVLYKITVFVIIREHAPILVVLPFLYLLDQGMYSDESPAPERNESQNKTLIPQQSRKAIYDIFTALTVLIYLIYLSSSPSKESKRLIHGRCLQ